MVVLAVTMSAALAAQAPLASDPCAAFAADAETVWRTVGPDVAVMVGSGTAILAHHAATTGRRLPRIDAADGPDPLRLARRASALSPEAAPPKPVYIRAADAKPQLPVPGLLQ